MRRVVRRATLLLALLLAAASLSAEATALYVNRVVIAAQGDLKLSDLVSVKGDTTPKEREALARSVTVVADKVLYVPLSVYLAQINDAFGSDAIIVGARSIVLPKGAVAESEGYLFDRLADYLIAQALLGEGRVEITLTQNLVKGTVPQEGIPVFQAVKTARGVTEVSYTLADAASSVTGRISFPTSSASASSGAEGGVRSGQVVQVVFHKGPITIEMPGKALSTAGIGEQVKVLITESQKTFTGSLGEGKAVDVELP